MSLIERIFFWLYSVSSLEYDETLNDYIKIQFIGYLSFGVIGIIILIMSSFVSKGALMNISGLIVLVNMFLVLSYFNQIRIIKIFNNTKELEDQSRKLKGFSFMFLTTTLFFTGLIILLT
jgi:hypothetical protein